MTDPRHGERPRYLLWISTHQWSLIQRGNVPARLEKPLPGRRRLVVELAVDGAGRPSVQRATIEGRRLLSGYRCLDQLAPAAVVVHVEES